MQIEVSRVGNQCLPLNFRYAPDDPGERPAFVVPHQPRIAWMLWFVSMSPVFLEWFERLLVRLAEGSPAVTATLARPPPAGAGPLRLRVSL